MNAKNIPLVRMGLVCVSRNNFLMDLSSGSRDAVTAACAARGIEIFPCPTIVENERDVVKALEQLNAAGCNALTICLGNFGPEAPETMLAKEFSKPTMYVAVAEESSDTMYAGRRDSYCGLLNCSYNLHLRNVHAYIPQYPVAAPEEIAGMIAEFRSCPQLRGTSEIIEILRIAPKS